MKRAFGLGLFVALFVLGLQAEDQPPQDYVVPSGTRIPLVLVNGISTKNAREGDRVYLQTAFPIFVRGHKVIPDGSYVIGTLTEVKRPGRVKGRGELYVRFDTLTLPNGVERDFRARVSGVDGDTEANLKGKEAEGKIEGDSTKGKDVGTVVDTGATGATIGGIAGAGKGAGIGAGIGGAAGLGAILLTRGPDLKLPRGSSLEMQLDRQLSFAADDINFVGSAAPAQLPPPPPSAQPHSGNAGPGRLPLPRPF